MNLVKEEVLNKSLIFGAVAGFITYFISLTQWRITGFEISFITDFVILISIVVIAIYRNRINLLVKSYLILFCILAVVFVDVYEIGILSANKVLLILIPFFAFVSFSRAQVILFSMLTLLVILTLGFLHLNGNLSTIVNENLGLSAWIINLAMISVVTYLVILLMLRFNNTYELTIEELELSNELLRQSERNLGTYKDQLEKLVEKRTAKLKEANSKLESQKNEIQESLAKLKRAQDELVQSEKLASLGMISSNIAHEINNPLNYIKGGLTGLRRIAKDKLPDSDLVEMNPFLEAATEGVKRASVIVKSMSQYNRSKESMDERCDVFQIIGNCLKMLEYELTEGTDVVNHLHPDLPLVRGNMGKLHQLFMNILTNAIHAFEEPGRIEIRGVTNVNVLNIEVHDNGRGISEEILKKIFEPFFTTKEVGKGTGLGLFICDKIIKEHGGSIEINSQVGLGTTVRLSLPIH